MRGRFISTKIIPCSITNPHPEVIWEAAEVIMRGGLVVYPTDTFYGLGGNPKNRGVIQRIFMVKGRPEYKPLPLIISNKGHLKEWAADISTISEGLIKEFWPGPLTILFKAAPSLPRALTAGTGKIGIRWPYSPVAVSLAEKTEKAIISTSANLSGKGGIVDPKELLNDLEGFVDIIIDSGILPLSKGSTVVDCTCDPVKIIRDGDIPGEKLRIFLEK